MVRSRTDRAKRVVLAGGLVLLVAVGCSATEPDFSKYKVKPRGTGATTTAPSQPPPPAPPRQPMEATSIDWNAQAQQAPQAEAAKAPPRDYAAELQQAVGSPVDCLKPRLAHDAPAQIVVALEATVLESGYVTRGAASSAQLEAEELACLNQRVERARFAPQVEAAPRTVRASVTLELKRAPAPVPSAPQPPPAPPGIVTPPSSALPAQGPPVPRDPNALPVELPPPQPIDPNAIPQRLPDPIPLQR